LEGLFVVQQIVQALNSEILYTEEVAALARKPVATLRWLRATGKGPKSGKLGRRVIYRRADVEAWIASAFEDGAV
jgi:predicted DNA-binding transcriptional regulator AlpA